METVELRQEMMRLALRHRADIWGLLMGLTKDPIRAEDLFQDTYVVICEKWRQFRPGTDFVAWARQIARFKFLASVDPARRPEVVVEAEVLESAMDAARDEREPERPQLDALRHCIGRLQGRSRRVIDLRYGEGLPGPRTAEVLNMSLNALYTLLSRVRQGLMECVERRLRLEDA